MSGKWIWLGLFLVTVAVTLALWGGKKEPPPSAEDAGKTETVAVPAPVEEAPVAAEAAGAPATAENVTPPVATAPEARAGESSGGQSPPSGSALAPGTDMYNPPVGSELPPGYPPPTYPDTGSQVFEGDIPPPAHGYDPIPPDEEFLPPPPMEDGYQ